MAIRLRRIDSAKGPERGRKNGEDPEDLHYAYSWWAGQLFFVDVSTRIHCIGDHIFGIAPLMAGCLNGAGGMIDGVDDPRTSRMPENISVSLDNKAFISLF